MIMLIILGLVGFVLFEFWEDHQHSHKRQVQLKAWTRRNRRRK